MNFNQIRHKGALMFLCPSAKAAGKEYPHSKLAFAVLQNQVYPLPLVLTNGHRFLILSFPLKKIPHQLCTFVFQNSVNNFCFGV